MTVASPVVALRLRPEDQIAIATANLAQGQQVTVGGTTVTLEVAVKLGHKFALAPIAKGDPVRKFGQIIGFANQAIEPGEHVHVQNLEAGEFTRDYAYATAVPPPLPRPSQPAHFMGFDRGGGRFGTRNYIGIISTVNCSATTNRYIAERIREKGILKDFPAIDGVVPITHKAGCAMQYGGEDHKQLDRTLAGTAGHANIGAYIILGLGCETGQASHLIEGEGLIQLGRPGKVPPLVLNIQDLGGIAKTVDAGFDAVVKLFPRVNEAKRVPLAAEHLILGTNCGGSDGNSGVTANPALGIASDILISHGGTSVLAETTEIYGAEHLLTRRAISQAVGEKLVARLKWWEWYTGIFGTQINNNPSVGNKEGGLTTIYEKSLGAVAKGGSTAMMDVVRYAEPIRAKGFVVMDTPGYDPVSMTGLVAGGCNVCVFTTGRGSVFGCKPSPSIKVATNTPMFRRMEADMDIDAGVILSGTPVEEVGRIIFEEILAVASGKKTKSELNGVGDEEFAPWSIGPTL